MSSPRSDHLLARLAERSTDETLAFRFLDDGEELAWAGLATRAAAIGAELARRAATDRPVLVAQPLGAELIASLFGCWLAGAIAVPVYPPRGSRHRARFDAVRADCGASLALGPTAEALDLDWLDTRELPPGPGFDPPPICRAATCLLQYTSGSTAAPKGVRISHANLAHQLSAFTTLQGSRPIEHAVSWLPAYHDMGLVAKILHAVWGGFPLTLMNPETFIRRPLTWLETISREQAEFSGAPNFAYELCLRDIPEEGRASLDLSSWIYAPVGAERVRADTMRRFAEAFADCGFRAESLMPAYGLAEATLVVTLAAPDQAPKATDGAIATGQPLAGTEVKVVGAAAACADGEVGEIVVRGDSICAGYWNRDAPGLFTADGFLRTGDLGYWREDGLVISSRIKDLIVIDGRNLAPEDLEAAVSGDGGDAAAAFAVDDGRHERAVVLLETATVDPATTAERVASARRALAERHDLAGAEVIPVRRGTLPRTTSGKIRRAACREAWSRGRLRPAPLATRAGETGTDRWAAKVLAAYVAVTERPPPDAGDDPAAHGLSSLQATRIAALLHRETGRRLELADVFAARHFSELGEALARCRDDALPPVERATGPPVLTHAQKRMWFLQQLDPTSAAYHVFGCLELRGRLDPERLEDALRQCVERHEALRSIYPAVEGRVRPQVLEPGAPALERLAEADPEARLEAFAAEPFDLARGPLLRTLLVDRGGDRHLLALCAHHIVADGWSARIFLRDLARAYAGRLPRGETRLRYFDYAAWHRRLVSSDAVRAQLDYWKARLAGHSGTLELPTDFPPPRKPSSAGGLVKRRMPNALVQRLEREAGARRSTPFVLLLAAWLVFLRRHTARRDLVVAVPVANRNQAETGELVGTLVNTLPFRARLDDHESFERLVERVHRDALAMQQHQDIPFEAIVEALQPQRRTDRPPLAQVMFDHQELPVPERWSDDLRCQPYLTSRGAAQFELALFLFALGEHHELAMEYRSELFRRNTVEVLLDRYLESLEALLADPTRALEAHGTGTPALAGPSKPDYPRQTVPALILDQVARRGDRPAVADASGSLDYSGLLRNARAFAAHLRRSGVAPGDRVALLLPRDRRLPAAVRGVWLAGAAYVPLDPANPPERLALILEDQDDAWLVADREHAARLPAHRTRLDADFEDRAADEEAALAPPGEPAYVIYTSGSTGRPKGVVVSHGALANFILSMRDRPGLAEGDHLLALTTLSFDISTLELFLPLVVGARVEVVDSRTARDAQHLRARIESAKPTAIQATPATWRMLVAAGWSGDPRLKLLCGGEAMDPELARALQDRAGEVWNLYGPTETTVWSTIWRLPEGLEAISIGEPIANTRLVLLDRHGLEVPDGVVGELAIGGAGLAEGYWRLEQLTAERFIMHRGRRYYLTGDLAKRHLDGRLECRGRVDGQVKRRGFRVELGEIEAALSAHPAVVNAGCVIDREQRLLAWATCRDGAAPEDRLRDFLAERLPDYMLPARILATDAMPLNANGKIDREALSRLPIPDDDQPPAPAATALESEILALWGELLGGARPGRDDDFFALGGHSLLAVRMTSELKRRTGIDARLDWLFESPTVAGLLAQVERHGGVDLGLPRPILLGGESASPPIFWMQTLVDGGMGLLPYREAVRQLDGAHLSYGMAEGERAFDRFEDLAAAHLESIRRAQPEGPYRLAGFCFGGNLALEVAAQLRDQGQDVALVMLLESLPPGRVGGARQAIEWRALGRVAWRLPGQLNRVRRFDVETAARRARMKGRVLADHFGRRGGEVDGPIPNIHSVLDLEPLDAAARERATRHWRALHRHRPRVPEVGRLVLVRAANEGWLPRSPSLGWNRWTDQLIEVFEVPGRHEEFLREGSTDRVCDVIRRVLRGIESGRVSARRTVRSEERKVLAECPE